MKTVTKTKKVIIIAIISIFVLVLGFFIWKGEYYKLIFIDQKYYGDTYKTLYSFDGTIYGKLASDAISNMGYIISYPGFDGNSPWNHNKYFEIYATLQLPGADYAFEIVNKYNNYAKLDYEIEIVKNETITIKFTGYGYPDEGRGEPVPLDKDFVFDISNVSLNKLPVLISN